MANFKDINLKLFFIILPAFLAFGTCQFSTKEKNSLAPATRSDTVHTVIIQNSLPKGGGYTDPAGKMFGYRIFWSRVKNNSVTPLELTIQFPADSFAIAHLPGSYIRFFLPPGTMTPEKEPAYDYGVTGLNAFLDTGLHKPAILQETIDPGEEYFFYTGVLLYQADGAARAGLILKDQNLFFRISISTQLDSVLIPCGQIVFKK